MKIQIFIKSEVFELQILNVCDRSRRLRPSRFYVHALIKLYLWRSYNFIQIAS